MQQAAGRSAPAGSGHDAPVITKKGGANWRMTKLADNEQSDSVAACRGRGREHGLNQNQKALQRPLLSSPGLFVALLQLKFEREKSFR